MFDEVLSGLLLTIEGVRAALLIGMDGIIVAGAGDTRDVCWDLVAASYADIARKVGTANREAEIGSPSEIIMVSPSATVVFRSVTPDYGLLVALEPLGSLGKTRFELRKAAHRVLPDLEV